MADKFFTNFPEIQYRMNDGKVIYIKDFFRKSKIEQESVSSIVEYSTFQTVSYTHLRAHETS